MLVTPAKFYQSDPLWNTQSTSTERLLVLSTPARVKEASWQWQHPGPHTPQGPEWMRVFVFIFTKSCQTAAVQSEGTAIRAVGGAGTPLGPAWAFLAFRASLLSDIHVDSDHFPSGTCSEVSVGQKVSDKTFHFHLQVSHAGYWLSPFLSCPGVGVMLIMLMILRACVFCSLFPKVTSRCFYPLSILP